jgi:hypothetical protein
MTIAHAAVLQGSPSRIALGSANKQLGRSADADREFKLTQTLREDKQP